VSGTFSRKYGDAERSAIVAAFGAGVTARVVAERAAAGELEHDGQPLPPFELPVSSVRSLARDARRDRTGETATDDDDRVAALRRRAIECAERLLRDYELTVSERPGEAQPKRLREIFDIIEYAAHLPRHGGVPAADAGLAGPMMRDLRSNGAAGGRAPGAPGAPGALGAGNGEGVGVLLADLRASQGPPSEPPPAPATVPEAPSDSGPEPEPADTPGAFVQERVTRLLAEAAGATPQADLATAVGRPSTLPTEPEAPARVAIREPDGFDHRRLRTEDTSSIDGADPRRTEAVRRRDRPR
jgi:hypothetical protein